MDTTRPTTIVLGAGVVGLSTALYLQRSGHNVTVVDPLPPAGGASYGNSGLISSDTAVPIALPGMLGKVPKWLADPMGPLVVRPSYFPRALPWLLRWIAASRMERVLKISDAMRALHKESLKCWREMLGPELFADLILPVGQIRLWEGGGAESTIEMAIAERHGIRAEPLDGDALRQIYPEIAPGITRGLLIPGNAYTVSPQRLVRTLGELLVAAGGEIVAERTQKIIPRGGAAGFLLMNNISNRTAQRVVVATGASTRELLDPLGIRVPLHTERGYHAMMPSPNITLKIPMSIKNRGFGLTSMEDGLRAGGTVEIDSLHAAPNERRAMILVEHVKRVFPTLQTGEPRYWMGHRPSTPDSLPVLGVVPSQPGLFLAFGHGHFGMTGGPPSGRLVAQLINGAAPAIDPAPYSCTRF
ncbi:MAG: FAD-dependent oxidoreductase [Betaproteobacteria bacterium]|nr:FAD-dependent oxidoreductase [Betaproteobacteria bacterium]